MFKYMYSSLIKSGFMGRFMESTILRLYNQLNATYFILVTYYRKTFINRINSCLTANNAFLQQHQSLKNVHDISSTPLGGRMSPKGCYKRFGKKKILSAPLSRTDLTGSGSTACLCIQTMICRNTMARCFNV